jgi:hypothetical protein
LRGRLSSKTPRPADFPDLHHGLGINMEKYATELKLLLELDERHDEVLRQIDALDKQVQEVLALWTEQREEQKEAA